ncbi:ABC transporter ATP-binding protein [Serratia sp. N21D137]|uniref:ABC transporter ATP-binding protein n=1 Tax=Serratia sp. N21D137 TaxID=3397495 RepID=UPI0039E05382
MDTSPKPLILQGVSLHSQNDELILDDINFIVNTGERLAIIGPNGSGKSSLLRIIIQENTYYKGNVLFNGRPIKSISVRERSRQIAFLSQTDTPDWRLTLEEYVTLGRLPYVGLFSYAKEQQKINKALENTGLKNLRHRQLGLLSGGQRQRAAFARTLVQEPSLLLLDEPTNHLDPQGRAELMSLVKNQGITVVAVLHDLQLTATFADKVLVLCQGKQVIYDVPDSALRTEIMLPVFGMKSFDVLHPENGHTLKIFEAPLCA